MRPLLGLRHDVARRHPDELPVEARERLLDEHPRDRVEALLPLRALVLALDAEAAELGLRRRLAGAELEPPARDQVERGGPLRDPRRVVERGRQLHDPVAEPYALGPLRRGSEENLRGARVRVLLEEVVLDLPDVVEARAVGELYLLESVAQQLLVGAVLPRPRHLVLVEDPEAHRALRTLPADPLPAAHALEAEPGEVHHAGDEELALHLRVVAPPDRERLHGAAQLLGEHLYGEPPLGLRLAALSRRDRLGGHQARDRLRGLLLEALEQLRHVGLEVVPEEQPERARVRLDPLEERVDTVPQSHLARLRAGGGQRQGLEDLLDVTLQQGGVQLLLRREVLVDQRL